MIKANNPEVVAILGDEYCHLVCDLELDYLEEDQWAVSWLVAILFISLLLFVTSISHFHCFLRLTSAV